MFGISGWELLVVAFVLFLAVGPDKLPKLAKQIGKGLRDLRQGITGLKSQVGDDDEFVKAVRDARDSVREAKESIRGIFEFDEGEEEAHRVTDVSAAARPEQSDAGGTLPRGVVRKRPPRDAELPDEPLLSEPQLPGETQSEQPATDETAIATAPPTATAIANSTEPAAAPDPSPEPGSGPAPQPRPQRRRIRPGKKR